MASLAADLPIRLAMFALTGTGATDVYTAGDQGESAIKVTSIRVTDSTGSVATAAKVVIYKLSNTTEYVLVPSGEGLPTAALSLEFVSEPGLRMERGDEVRVTGASGHHVFVGFVPIGLDQGTSAQKPAA
jgi:hypothetical protein